MPRRAPPPCPVGPDASRTIARTAERFAGIDVGARRYHVSLLSSSAELLVCGSFATASVTAEWIGTQIPDSGVVAVDAPLRTAEGLLLDPEYRATISPPPPEGRYLNYRECDYQLIRRRLPLYQVPVRYSDCPAWMRAGFAVYDALLATGRWSLFDGDPSGNRLLEVYPFAAFAVLLGQIPPAKGTRAGRAARIAALTSRLAAGSDLDNFGHDELDATAAAITALTLRQGTATWVGNPREALMVLPGKLKETYTRPQVKGKGTLNGAS
jgi:predicted nuclease with RNAse H fold